MQQLLLNLLPDHTPSLSHFMPGDNAELLEALRRWLEAPQAYPANLFVVWGTEGVGKSFLSRCLAEQGFAPLPLSEPLAPLTRTGWLLDDVQNLDATGQQDLFRHLIHLAQSNQRLFVTLDTSPDMQRILREDVRTRLGAGHIYRLTPLNENQQRILLAQRAAQRGWQLTDDVLDTLYQRAPRDLSNLTRLIERLDQLSLEQKRRITLPLLRTALNEANAPIG
ncbi:MAG: DnaA regulatory inactivator Hda [Rhodocyclaceae bacterium]|jgi:DnaA family protein|nr:DnaA regulatory inactivator Hda [Rhodocyclaceae bacterium]